MVVFLIITAVTYIVWGTITVGLIERWHGIGWTRDMGVLIGIFWPAALAIHFLHFLYRKAAGK